MIHLFHDIVKSPTNEWQLTPEEFENTLKRILQEDKAPEFHFDDGRLGVYKYAYPIMKKYGIVGKMFLIAAIYRGFCIPSHENYSRFMSVEQIQELISNEWTIGSHSWSHKALKNENKIYTKTQLLRSKEVLTNTFCVNITEFSFPYGLFDNESVKEAEKCYDKLYFLSSLPEQYNENTHLKRICYCNDRKTNKSTRL
jgi:peptidoglycan/xylan/chitin deacetylase (PgdA/CDA1 family)